MEGVYLYGVFVPFGHREEVQYYFTGLFQPSIQRQGYGCFVCGYIARYIRLYSQLYLVVQLPAIQPDITGYLAKYIWLIARCNWLYCQLAVEIILLSFVAQLDSQTSYSKLRYIASYRWLYSYWLYSQIYLAIQPGARKPLNSHLSLYDRLTSTSAPPITRIIIANDSKRGFCQVQN